MTTLISRRAFAVHLLRNAFLGFALLFVLFLGVPHQSAPSPTEKSSFVGKTGRLVLGKLATLSAARQAHAADLDGELDNVADLVYGQNDFASKGLPASASAVNQNQATDLFVYDTGQLFVADTEHNRVLIWDSVDTYSIGDPADIVLGQPDFITTDAPSPPRADSMNQPSGLTVGYDGILYVSDTGNHRVLVFVPWNICDFYEYYDDIWCIEADGYEFSDYFVPVFTTWMNADYALGQPDLTTGTLRAAAQNSLNHPMGVVTDVNDNLVVADRDNNRVLIYEWPLSDGQDAVWIVGQTADNGKVGNFTSTEAPNPPTRLSLNGPTSVAAGTLGNELYVADTGNNRVLVFTDDPIDGFADAVIGQPDYISKGAGVGETRLDGPTGLKMDAGNRLFVADRNNNRVLFFDQVQPDGNADGVIGQPDFASNGANNGGIGPATLSAPTGIATDAYFMDVYIADRGNNRVLQYSQPLQNPSPVISELNPGTVLAGSDGFTLDVWGSGIIQGTVVEINGSARITGTKFLGISEVKIAASELETSGEITITLRNPLPGGGVSAPYTLSVYEPVVGDDQADSVLGQKGFTTDDGAFVHLAANTLFEPGGVVVDPTSGRIFVSDQGNSRILSWPSTAAQANGKNADLVIGQPDFQSSGAGANPLHNILAPAGLALDSAGNLYAADAQLDVVQVYSPPFSNGIAASATITGFSNPLAVAVDSLNNLYVTDSLNNRVLFYEQPLSGDLLPDRVYGQADLSSTDPNRGGAISADTLHFPAGLALDSSGNLYISDASNHRVLVYLAGTDGDTGADAGADVVFGQAGDFTSGIANNGGVSAQSLNFPFGLLIDAEGSLYVTDSDNNRLLRYDAPLTSDRVADEVYGQGGSFTQNPANRSNLAPTDGARINGGGRSQASLREPSAIALSPDGSLYVADYRNNRVLAFQTDRRGVARWGIFLPSVAR